jgi:tetratricopeptide (TPR) repeat protein
MRALAVFLVALATSACAEPKPQPQSSAATDTSSAKVTMTSKSPEAIERLKKGEVLLVNLRTSEAAAELAEALKLDPGFVLAHATHGQATPGPEGLKELEAAAASASALPEAERTMIEGMLASRQNESAKAREAFTKVTQLAPADWRGFYLLGTQLLGAEDYTGAVPALRKAIELDPAAGGANNMMGYAALRQGDTDGAIKAFTEYTRALPQEPNPQDSLGEALLAAGKFKEAEAAFLKAFELSPQFFGAYDGVAYAKYYAGDATGALDALAKEKAAATRPVDKLGADELRAIMLLAQNKTAEGLALYTDLEKMTDAMPAVALVPAHRAYMLVELGRGREAMPIIAAALKRADSGELPPALSRTLRDQALGARIVAEVAAKNAEAAQQTAVALQQLATERPDDVTAQSAMHFGMGMAAMGKRDYAGARGHFEKCLSADFYCRAQTVTAAAKAGDKAGADAARAAFLKLYVRDPIHLWERSRLQDESAKSSTE